MELKAYMDLDRGDGTICDAEVIGEFEGSRREGFWIYVERVMCPCGHELTLTKDEQARAERALEKAFQAYCQDAAEDAAEAAGESRKARAMGVW